MANDKFLIPGDYYFEGSGDITNHNNFITIRNLDNSPNPELTKAIADFCKRNWPDFEENFTVEAENGYIYSRWNNTDGGAASVNETGFYPLSSMVGDYGVYGDANAGFEVPEDFEQNWDYIISSFSYDPNDGFDPDTIDIDDRQEKYKIRVTALSRNGNDFIMDCLDTHSIWDTDDIRLSFKYYSSFYEDLYSDGALYQFYELDNLPDGTAKIAGYIDGDHIRSLENDSEYACVPPAGWNNCDNDTDHNIYVTTED